MSWRSHAAGLMRIWRSTFGGASEILCEYDHTKTFMEDGHIDQFFYLVEDAETGLWTIVDNSTNGSRRREKRGIVRRGGPAPPDGFPPFFFASGGLLSFRKKVTKERFKKRGISISPLNAPCAVGFTILQSKIGF